MGLARGAARIATGLLLSVAPLAASEPISLEAPFLRQLTLLRQQAARPLRLSGSSQAPQQNLEQRAGAIVLPLIAQLQGSGAVVAFVDAQGSRVFGYGETARGNGITPGADTLFESGSLTKLFTGLALADAVSQGGLSVDDPVQALLPSTVRMPDFQGRPIALRHLATHSSGLPRMPDNVAPADPMDPYADYDLARLYAFLNGHRLARAPETTFEYSNLGAGLLGHALALRAGLSYEDLVLTRVCGPLGLKDTRIQLDAGRQARVAQGYFQGQATPLWSLGSLPGAGALRSTADDLARFAAANLGLLQTSLAPAIALSHQPHEGKTPIPGGHIGLFWLMASRPHGELVAHGGATYGHQAYILLNTTAKRGVILLINAGPANGTDESVAGAAGQLFNLPP